MLTTTMPYFEPMLAPDLEATELINLKRILELCTVPNVGKSPLDSGLTQEMRCMNALTTLEKTTAVFDDAFYQDAVFTGELDEDKLDRHLLDSAMRKGVPQDHFPARCMKNPPPCPAAPTVSVVRRPTKLVKMGSGKSMPALPTSTNARPDTSHGETTTRKTPRATMSLPASFRKASKASLAAERSRATSPAPSFFSFSSRAPKSPRFKGKDGLMGLFKRDRVSSRGVEEWNPPPPPPPATDVPSLISSSSRTTRSATLGENNNNNRSSHLSSSPSASISSRTSTSSVSVVDLSAYSWVEGRTIQRMSRNPGFIILRVRCVNEAKRFVDFAQHQRVALPLFLGRTKMYLEDRTSLKLAELRKKHDRVREELENKHLEQELFELDEHTAETADQTVKNATALKYINKRIDLLGEAATEVEKDVLDAEQHALDRLADKQQRQIRNLHRFQYRERQDVLRAQQKELEALTEESEAKASTKTADLEKNMRRLEELIHVRSMRLVARWHLMLQIYKTEDRDGVGLRGGLPLSLLGLPEEFARYVAAFQV